MKTHYDVLNVDKNSTEKEIKDAFIKLSKLYHPDTNKDKNAHAKFVELNEAYSVLGKSGSRHNYDISLKRFESEPGSSRVVYNRPNSYDQYREFYAQQRQSYQGGGEPVFTMTKLRSVLICCIVVIFGSALQLKAEVHRRRTRSQDIALMLKEVRDRANERRQKSLKEAVVDSNITDKGFQK